MEYRLNEDIQNEVRVSYASGEATAVPRLDCGEGVNLEYPCAAAAAALADLTPAMLGAYPHGTELKDALIEHWAPFARLTRSHLALTEGSVGALYLANRLFLRQGAKVLAGQSLFFEYATDVRLHGAVCDEVRLAPCANWRFDAERFLAALTSEYRLVYIDNPHNPTGQAVPLEQIKRVVSQAQELGLCVLVDEAYGGFMPDGNSAVALLDRYENVLVARSFSKAYGLGGLRAGYLALRPELAKYAANLSNPYVIGALSRHVASAAVRDAAFPPDVRGHVAEAKAKLLRPWRNLSFAETCPTVNICMITHTRAEIDLAAEFARRGVAVISCAGFAGKNSVRLRVPAKKDVPFLLDVMEEIDQMR